MNARWLSAVLLLVLAPGLFDRAHADTVRVGSKNFNESYILGEVVAQLLESQGHTVQRRFGLGGTLICYQALKNGEIDLYVEYTGTLSQAVLNLPGNPGRSDLNVALDEDGLALMPEFGFNNTYAIAVRDAEARQRQLATIGDLARAPDLRMVFSHEFLEREDGWPGLKSLYGLNHAVTGIEHGLAYQAISEGAIDVTDAYSTDGELVRYALTVLEDDLNFFPSYFAAPLVRQDLSSEVVAALARLEGTLTGQRMQQMNAAVVFEGQTFAAVAAQFLNGLGVETEGAAEGQGLWPSLLANTLRHLQLTGMALALAIVAGIGLSLMVYRRERLAATLIYLCGLLQTIPSIALLALMIPLFGIGMLPAVAALFLYSLLPILRNTVTALTSVDPTLVRVALAMGLTEWQRLRHVLVPISLPAIFAGIRTAAVISIGTATLAAFIGAGGLGDPIVVGLALDNVHLILQGAIPAAILAIVTELVFEAVEYRLTRRPTAPARG